MYQVIIVVHVLLGLGVVGLVLLQQGKGADAGAAFGSASSGSVFGAQGASSFLSRTTAILATLFFSTSLGLAVLSGSQEGPVDLMETPEVEKVFTDLPLVNDSDNKAPIKAIPLSKDDVPANLVSPEDVSEKVKSVAGAVQDKTKEAIEDTKAVVTDELDTVIKK